jgi:hypothetical protein
MAFKTYVPFRLSANENDFPLTDNTGIWPNVWLNCPVFGSLYRYEIYFPEGYFLPLAATEAFLKNSMSLALSEGEGGRVKEVPHLAKMAVSSLQSPVPHLLQKSLTLQFVSWVSYDPHCKQLLFS